MIPTIGHDNGEPSGTAESADAAFLWHPQQTPGGFEQRLLARARALKLGPGARIVVAFSGGRDSLALAAAMRWAATRLQVKPLLIHVDHRLRATSGVEANRAEGLGAELGLRVLVHAVLESVIEVHRGVGIEEAARRERYRILTEAARAEGATVIATAHHREDQAETVLLHLLRGGGVHGARAMAEVSDASHWLGAGHDISHQSVALRLWRPLLHESRAQIEAFLEALALEPIADPTNDDRTPRRNALRHELLPRLEEQFPGAAAALARFAELAAADDLFLDELAAKSLAETVDQAGALQIAGLLRRPIALQRRMVRRWIAPAAGPEGLSLDRTEAILGLARAGRGGRTIEVRGGWTVRRERGMLLLGLSGEKGGARE